MNWWMWAIFGFALLIAETVVSGTLFLLFFGVSALAIAALNLFGPPMSETFQWILFGLFSIVSLVLLRSRLLQIISGRKTAGSDISAVIGEYVIPSEDIPPQGIGQGELRGVNWNVRNKGNQIAVQGTRYQVLKMSGLTIEIEPS